MTGVAAWHWEILGGYGHLVSAPEAASRWGVRACKVRSWERSEWWGYLLSMALATWLVTETVQGLC